MAIPEIQRPFVWDAIKVRNLLDSLYLGYPIGYLIIWQNPDVKLKDGSKSQGKKILIDGQQRVLALMASILGRELINKSYQRVRIRIAFNPIEEKFEVANPAIQNDKRWIYDLMELFSPHASLIQTLKSYISYNPDQGVLCKFVDLEDGACIMKGMKKVTSYELRVPKKP